MENTVEGGSIGTSNEGDQTARLETSYTLEESDFYAQQEIEESTDMTMTEQNHDNENHDGTDNNPSASCEFGETANHSELDGHQPQAHSNVQQVQKQKKYICTVCTKGFSDSGNLTQHIRTHTGERPYACQYCHKRFAQQSNMRSHEQLHIGKALKCRFCPKVFAKASNLNSHESRHTGQGNYKCDFCNKAFFYRFELNNHLQSHAGAKPFKCDHCNMSFSQKKRLSAHSVTHRGSHQKSPITSFQHVCDVCKKAFKWQAELENHKIIHAKDKSFECMDCGKSFDTVTVFKLHMHSHSAERPFVCPETDCDKAFKLRTQLINHMVVHSDDKQFECDICKSTFLRKSNLISHRMTHLADQHRPHICKTCGKGCSYKSELIVHERSHTGEKPYKCDVCDARFSQKGNLSLHAVTHSNARPYKCSVKGCNRSYKLFADLNYHKKEKHRIGGNSLKQERYMNEQYVTEYRCKTCGKEFREKYGLKKHQCKVKSPKLFSCNKCPKTFKKSHKLQKHKHRHHTETYKCNECNVTFVTDLLRKKHEETHKQCVCSTCGQGFKTEVDYNEHMMIHSAKAQAEMHKCSACGQVFSGASNLRMHETREHGLSPFRCKLCVEGFLRASQLKKHEEKHLRESSHRCQQCSEPFLTESDLVLHMEVHTKTQPYKCEKCGELFKLKRELTKHACLSFKCTLCNEELVTFHELENHILNEHMKKESYGCSQCSQEFSQMSSLRMHEKKEHGLDPFLCSLCGLRFPTVSEQRAHSETHKKLKCKVCDTFFQTKSALTFHESTHDQNLKCQFCSQEFPTEGDLNLHIESCQPEIEMEDAEDDTGDDEQKESFSCSVCHKSFPQYRNMQAHQRKVHSIQPYKCTKCKTSFRLLSALKRHNATKHSGKKGASQKIHKNLVVTNQKKQPNSAGKTVLSVAKEKSRAKKIIKTRTLSKAVVWNRSTVRAKTARGRVKPKTVISVTGIVKGKKPQRPAEGKSEKPNSSSLAGRGRGKPRKMTENNSHQQSSKGDNQLGLKASPGKPFKCNQCEMRFVSASRKMQHQQSHS